MTAWPDVADNAVKIGLPGILGLLTGWAFARQRFRQEEARDYRRRRQELIEKIAVGRHRTAALVTEATNLLMVAAMEMGVRTVVWEPGQHRFRAMQLLSDAHNGLLEPRALATLFGDAELDNAFEKDFETLGNLHVALRNSSVSWTVFNTAAKEHSLAGGLVTRRLARLYADTRASGH